MFGWLSICVTQEESRRNKDNNNNNKHAHLRALRYSSFGKPGMGSFMPGRGVLPPTKGAQKRKSEDMLAADTVARGGHGTALATQGAAEYELI